MSQKRPFSLFSCLPQPFAYPHMPLLHFFHSRHPLPTSLKLGIFCVCHSRLIHTGQFLNDLAAPVAMGGPPLVSSTWFPPNQRATATAIASLTSYVGISISFGVGPFVLNPSEVADPPIVNVTAPDSVAAGSNSTTNS